MDLHITDRAVDKLQRTAQAEGIDLDETVLRIAIVQGGCSGLTYDLGWDTTVKEDDGVLELENFRVVVDRRSLPYLDGTELDFSDGLEGKGFHFENPQAARTCACGESFGM